MSILVSEAMRVACFTLVSCLVYFSTLKMVKSSPKRQPTFNRIHGDISQNSSTGIPLEMRLFWVLSRDCLPS
jgi:hypothetical protein